MPLLDLKTELKSLKFNNRPPYIQKDINNPGVPSANQVQARLEDASRLTQLLASPKGAQWLTKQVALEASKASTLAGALNVNTVGVPAARLANMLLQIPVNGTGTHFISIGGAGIGNFYTRNSDAASEARYGGSVTINNPDGRSKVKNKSSEYKPTVVGRVYRNEAKTNGKVKLNARPALSDTKEIDRVNLLQIGTNSKEDRIPVTFNLYGDSSTILPFRGYVQNIQDNYTGNWNAVSYVGRMEQFFTYTGFTRTFSFQLVVPMFHEKEQPLVYNKLNSLVSYTTPKYNGDLPQGSIIELNLGNYIRSAGFINSISVTVANDVPWSMSEVDAYGPLNPRILPQVVTLNIQFTPIHTEAPQVYVKPFNRETTTMPFFDHGEKAVVLEPLDLDLEEIVDDPIFTPLPTSAQIQQALASIQNLINTFNPKNFNPRDPRPVIEVGDGSFGPPIFDEP